MALKIDFKKSNQESFKYSDLHLDLAPSKTPYGDSNLTRKSGNPDVRADYDEMAIRNSIRNLFLTRRGQRLLSPDYGLNLTQYLFEKIDEFMAKRIGREIKEGIKRYEPRVRLNKLDIEIDEENQEVRLYLLVNIPTLNRSVAFNGLFANNRFTL